jgi:type III pantothenate kinase
MILDIDAGNSRIKWRLSGNGRVLAQDSQPTAELASGETLLLPETAAIDEVRLASVAGSKVVAALQKQFAGLLKVAQVSPSAGGVTCGYKQPDRLGVDRWLALVAAYQQFKQAVLVVDAGSAMTMDLVGPKGEHLGGYIVPGLRLMADALWQGTVDVKVTSGDFENMLVPGTNSQQAVDRGCLLVAVSAVENLASQYPAHILLTGGDAQYLADALSLDHSHCPDLVLDGLAIADINFTAS